MSNVTLPTAQAITQAVGGIISKPIKVASRKEEKVILEKDCYVGSYDDGHGALEAVIVIDLSLCASFGAALALIPPAIAKEAVRDHKIEGDLKDNAYEVANILANSFTGRRVRLTGFVPVEEAPEQTKSLVSKAGKIATYDLTVQGYPGGVLRFCN